MPEKLVRNAAGPRTGASDQGCRGPIVGGVAASWYDPNGTPKFERPPVIETAAAIEFVPIEAMDSFALIRLQGVWEDRYPDLQEVPGAPQSPIRNEGALLFQVGPGGPRRIWAAGRGDGRLVQTQNDRLILNWRKMFSSEPYPGFDTLLPEFEGLWHEEAKYLADSNLPSMTPRLSEYTYVNAVSLDTAHGYPEVVNLIGAAEEKIPGKESFTRFQFIRDVAKSDDDPFEAQIFIQGEPQDYNNAKHLLYTITARTVLAEGDDPIEGVKAAHALADWTFAGLISEEKQTELGRER
jgi:uncharacterized protein (TIGR04255 family)